MNEAALPAKPVRKRKRNALRLPLWGWGTIGAVLIGGLLGIYMNMPEHASWRYGACKVFLERYVRFPDTLKVIAGWESQASTGIAFTDMNPFGAEQIRIFECYFSNTNGEITLSKITLDRKPIADEIFKNYSTLLPLLAAIETDTALPPPTPSALEDLKD